MNIQKEIDGLWWDIFSRELPPPIYFIVLGSLLIIASAYFVYLRLK